MYDFMLPLSSQSVSVHGCWQADSNASLHDRFASLQPLPDSAWLHDVTACRCPTMSFEVGEVGVFRKLGRVSYVDW